ncbi:putative envelope protein ODV-E56-2 [Microplitis demolitor]|uniref:putative envelope protein ODV-E56-2 n=1 Tax=Microplitis demolitor TaxID=69319 RepID=UPI00043FFF1D|nr:putative envelope protein ODV-E56-2 [Microplitis demolitor]KAG6558349.1 putative envelope protein ODV-E56-2 [Microplitis demolitor]
MRFINFTRKVFREFIEKLPIPKGKSTVSVSKEIVKSEAETLLKKFEVHEVHLSALESSQVEVKNLNGEVHINNHPWHEISSELESGRIGKFCEKLSIRSSLSHADELTIREIHFKNVPAKILADIEESFAVHSKKFGDIGTTKLKNAEKLSPKSKEKIIKYVTKSALIVVATGAAVGVTFASVVSEMHKAEGCFLYDGINQKSCKLTDRSCAYPQTSNTIQSCNPNAFTQFFNIKFNTNLNLAIRKTLQDPVKIQELKTALGVANITVDNIENLIEDHYDKINEFYELHGRPDIFDPCKLFEGSTKPICVACDSNAAINSYRYLDITELSINQKSYCSEDPSVLKALGTVLGESIKSLSDGLGVSSFFGTFFEYIMYAIVGFILLCGVGYAVSFIHKNKDDDDEVSYSKLENENN